MATVSHFGILFLLPYFLTVSFATGDDLLITTKDGQVQGKLLSVLGGDVRAFLGIPYGKPPQGNLRFRAPEPVEGWQGVKDATNYANTCYQLPDTVYPGFSGAEMWNPNTPVSEDCLYLNVWTPRFNNTQSSLAPVMVWIYGGSFTSGTSSLDLYDGRYLTKSEGVVVVSMNYRLGALGFLTLSDNENVRGNAGLLDQRLAIQWVVNNIAAFGGDPSQVTLFGESAGSVCVGFHVISPGSNGLFQRAVMESGVPTASWASISLTESQKRSSKLGELLGCSTSDPADLEACMQQAEVSQVAMMQYGVFSESGFLGIPFTPVIDGVFLPDKVDVLLSNDSLPKIEVLLGLNHDEGTYFLMYGMPGFNITGQSLISRDQFLNGVDLILKDADNVTKATAIFQYSDWTDENNSTKNRNSLNTMLTEVLFICPVQEFAHSFSQVGGKPFLYFFKHRSSTNPWPEWMGVMHGYEIEFVFGLPLNASLGYTEKEVNMTKRFMRHWANFARTGNPGIDGDTWPLFTPENKEYVTLDTNLPEKKMMLRANKCHLWTKLIPKIMMMADELETCRAKGLILGYNSTLLLILLALIFTF